MGTSAKNRGGQFSPLLFFARVKWILAFLLIGSRLSGTAGKVQAVASAPAVPFIPVNAFEAIMKSAGWL